MATKKSKPVKKAPAKKAAPKRTPAKKAAPAKKRWTAAPAPAAAPAAAPAPAKKPQGRPTTFTAALAQRIVDGLAEGIPLAVICREEGMPAVRTVSDWKKARPDFSTDFARAREDGYDTLAAQCLEIADDERQDWKLGKKGPVFDESAVSRSKLRVETRLKLLAKWDPKRYGERVVQEHTGPGGGPVQTLLGRMGRSVLPVVENPAE